MRNWKLFGRPLLPWWVYALYFALGVIVALASPSKGLEMAETKIKIDENAMARAISKALRAHLDHIGNYGDKAKPRDQFGGVGDVLSNAPDIASSREVYGGPRPRDFGRPSDEMASQDWAAKSAANQARNLNVKELGDPQRGMRVGDTNPMRDPMAGAKMQLGAQVAPQYFWEGDGKTSPANPGIRSDLEMQGRYGDTELAHVNPMEKALLKALGGAGTINPATGLTEFFDMGDAAAAAAAGDFGGAATDTAGTAGGVGGGATSDNSATGGLGDLGNLGIEAARGNFGAAGLGAVAPAAGFGSPSEGPSSGGLAGLIDKTLTAQKPGLFAPTSRLAYEAMDLIGGTLGRSMNDAWGGNAAPRESQFSGGQMGANGPSSDYASQAMATQPVAAPAPAYMRPQAQETPSNLGLQGLSDLQKRTMMATYGTQGAQSQYRTPEAMRAYGNLIARALIGDNNQVTGNETGTLPIEDQYLRQVFGVQKPNSAAALLEAIRPYWSQ